MSSAAAPRPPTVSRAALRGVLADLGLAPAVRVRPLGERPTSALAPRPPRVNALWRVDLRDGTSLVLRQSLVSLGWRGIAHEVAALPLARRAGVAVPPACHPLPARVFGRPAALVPRVPGTDGARLLALAPRRAPALFEAVGGVMGALAAQGVPAFALSADAAGAWAAREATWPAEWGAFARASAAFARRSGAWLGPLADDVERRFEAALPALRTARTWSLVHRDLHAANVVFERTKTGVVARVIDWETACLGDPVVDWALAIELPAAALAAVVRGYGAERVRATVLEPDALARLEAYALTRGLLGLASAALVGRTHGPWFRAMSLEAARDRCEALRAPGVVAARLRRALDAQVRRASRDAREAAGVDLSAALVRHGLDTFRRAPRDPAVLDRVVASLALGERATRSGSPTMQRRLLARARATLDDAAARAPRPAGAAGLTTELDRIDGAASPRDLARLRRRLHALG